MKLVVKNRGLRLLPGNWQKSESEADRVSNRFQTLMSRKQSRDKAGGFRRMYQVQSTQKNPWQMSKKKGEGWAAPSRLPGSWAKGKYGPRAWLGEHQERQHSSGDRWWGQRPSGGQRWQRPLRNSWQKHKPSECQAGGEQCRQKPSGGRSGGQPQRQRCSGAGLSDILIIHGTPRFSPRAM